jgi:hypothetical protein
MNKNKVLNKKPQQTSVSHKRQIPILIGIDV